MKCWEAEQKDWDPFDISGEEEEEEGIEEEGEKRTEEGNEGAVAMANTS